MVREQERAVGLRATSVAAGMTMGVVMTASALAEAPAMSANWLSFPGSQDECVKRGTAILKTINFKANFEVLGNRTLYGELGDYTAVLRCVVDKQIIFVAVAGPSSDLTDKYETQILKGF
jgi:hypothetical protein